ncbi:TPA: C4-dicarboxylate transporter DcuC [Serratia fonticola]|jgi:DcuC family C4-dicarboxylate transporter|uniref:C4-dicarboxylate transporter DcuC n=1 Tax=Serratia fonticola TaxID=47917 RepID=UPI000FC2AAF8|nr:C4-dicarboxylate transporter DcuC [Serratia fonticola]CAI0816558.1 Putative cryptic C4-dicarboxylate transporter DcuD [Serratia fonticola]CAI1184279.1 Putative cryptic C4-dicarboxylate transporter DcuD [Serratia fonticola]CAI1225208.1 Putative cryptic C4-dicarboxylate transporter DcuD [Serratia fonticola]CAI2008630.1 Putative cryptic C4-dicarboxylate transporter DcuD [Serratia fonticola]CAI2013287.1 Putative cryptic C4-dicarboxylate transporter DcuD [Serratia fonticola]
MDVALIISLAVLVVAGYAIAKNYDTKLVLFSAGIVLMLAAATLGLPILSAGAGTGTVWLDPLKQIELDFIKQFSRAGIIIMVLFGFSAYMSHIGANDVAVKIMSKPIAKIRSPYILVPIVFWIGSLLSLIIPSAASLAVILMATLYPILRVAKMSSLSAAGVIATTATIVPTPLGGDNVVAAKILGFEHVVDYVTMHHAVISLPVLVIIGIAHYFWQKYMDKRQGAAAFTDVDESKLTTNSQLPPAYYALFPLIPLFLIVVFGLFFRQIKIGLVEITLFSFALAFIVELIRKGDLREQMKNSSLFFTGMGQGFSQVVVLIVAASTLVAGLTAIGAISTVASLVKEVNNAGIGLMFIFSGLTALITLISGSGNAVFYSFIELIPSIANQAHVDPVMIALPMQLTSNLIRAISPVSAVVIIVASVVKVSPIEVVKRTSVPLLVGFVATLIFTLIRYSF